MVKALFLGLLAATICGLVFAAPAASSKDHPVGSNSELSAAAPFEDPAARSERSTNLSHVTGTARKIQMFIKNRHLQLLPDGTVNGTTDDTSAYSIFIRTPVGIGQIKIQGVYSCQYLCMDACGLLYGSGEFGDECIFNETIEQTNYNTYSSSKYSNERRTFYLALNRRGQSRKVVIKARQQLGKLSSYTRVLTRTVSPELQPPPMRHHGSVCPAPVASHQVHPHNESPRCRKRRKKKKKKRIKCNNNDNDEDNSELCQTKQKQQHHSVNRLKCDNADNDQDNIQCQREVTNKKRQKLNNASEKPLVNVQKKKKKIKKGVRKRLDQVEVSQESTTTTTLAPISTTPLLEDEDYGMESSTHSDWEDNTGLPDVSMAVSEAKHLAQTNLSD